MAGRFPRKGAAALSSATRAAAVAAKPTTAPWRRRPVSRTRAELALEGAKKVAEGAGRAAWWAAGSVGSLAAAAARRAGKAATEAAAVAGESVRRTALAKTESAKQLAVRGAQKTGRVVLEGGHLACRHAGAYIKTNATLAVAQMQRTFNEHSQKVAQATADLAARAISRHEQIKENIDPKQNEVTAELKRQKTGGANSEQKRHQEHG